MRRQCVRCLIQSRARTACDGTFYCINGGTVGGTRWTRARARSCDAGYGGTSCQTASSARLCGISQDGATEASTASTVVPSEEPLGRARVQHATQDTKVRAARPPVRAPLHDSSKDGSDGTFYCINGGTVGGNTGSCTCACSAGYEGTNCQTASACTASISSKDGATGASTASTVVPLVATTGSCTCTSCNAGYGGASCQTTGACSTSTDSSKDGSDGTFYCINGGTVGGTSGSCACTSCNAGYEGAELPGCGRVYCPSTDSGKDRRRRHLLLHQRWHR